MTVVEGASCQLTSSVCGRFPLVMASIASNLNMEQPQADEWCELMAR